MRIGEAGQVSKIQAKEVRTAENLNFVPTAAAVQHVVRNHSNDEHEESVQAGHDGTGNTHIPKETPQNHWASIETAMDRIYCID
jgi:hypothetical protein